MSNSWLPASCAPGGLESLSRVPGKRLHNIKAHRLPSADQNTEPGCKTRSQVWLPSAHTACPVTTADPILCPVAKPLILWDAGPLPFIALSDTPKKREELWSGKSGAHQTTDPWHLQGHSLPLLCLIDRKPRPLRGKETSLKVTQSVHGKLKWMERDVFFFGELLGGSLLCCAQRVEDYPSPGLWYSQGV